MVYKTAKEIIEYFKSIKRTNEEIVTLKIKESTINEIGYKSFIDLAQLYHFKMLTPNKIDNNTTELIFQRLNQENSFHKTENNSDEKYGIESDFFNIDKSSKFSFLYHYELALNFAKIKTVKSILNLGVNKGDEFKIIKEMISNDEWINKNLIGIDYSKSAIEYAKNCLPDKNISFISHDINKLDLLDLGRFDLLISIGTLQSVNIDFKKTFMNLVQNYLESNGSIILGFPNCRWIDKEMIYGATVPNYSFPEMSAVIKDIYFCKKYLQQKKYRVTITGKDYLFLVATK